LGGFTLGMPPIGVLGVTIPELIAYVSKVVMKAAGLSLVALGIRELLARRESFN